MNNFGPGVWFDGVGLGGGFGDGGSGKPLHTTTQKSTSITTETHSGAETPGTLITFNNKTTANFNEVSVCPCLSVYVCVCVLGNTDVSGTLCIFSFSLM